MDDMWEYFSTMMECEGSPEHTTRTITTCFLCKSDSLVIQTNDGHIVCDSCGAVNTQLIDKQQDQNTALAEGSGINMYLPKSSLGTSISGGRHMKLRLVNDWWKWVYKEKTFYDDKKDIETRCRTAGVTQAVIDNSLNLYKRLSETRHHKGKNTGKYVIIRGVNRRAIMAASVYYGARLQRQPKSPKEIADMFQLEIGQMTRGCKKFTEMVDLTSLMKNTEKNDVYNYVQSYCYRANLGLDLANKALEIVRNMQKLQLATNHQPPAVAATTLLLIQEFYGQINSPVIKKSELAEIFKVSDVTITKTFKEVYPWCRILTNSEIVDEYMEEILSSGSMQVGKSEG
jgi:transcription initiation factor TFIIIB Brf1 subunit/transcription initiation factor TFIIB